MREGDLLRQAVYPPNSSLDECLHVVAESLKANGSATDAGIRLKHWTVQAGVEREKIEASAGTWCYNTPEGRRVWAAHWPGRLRGGTFAERAVELGLATR